MPKPFIFSLTVFLFTLLYTSSAFNCSDITRQDFCSPSILCSWSNGLCIGSINITCSGKCVYVQNFNKTAQGNGSLQNPSNSLDTMIDSLSTATTIILIALDDQESFLINSDHAFKANTYIRPFISSVRFRLLINNTIKMSSIYSHPNSGARKLSLENLIIEPSDTNSTRDVALYTINSTELIARNSIFQNFKCTTPIIVLFYAQFSSYNSTIQNSDGFSIKYFSKPSSIQSFVTIQNSLIRNLTGITFLYLDNSCYLKIENTTIKDIKQPSQSSNPAGWLSLFDTAILNMNGGLITNSSFLFLKVQSAYLNNRNIINNTVFENLDLSDAKALFWNQRCQNNIINTQFSNIYNGLSLIAFETTVYDKITNVTFSNIKTRSDKIESFGRVQLFASILSAYSNTLDMVDCKLWNIASPAIFTKKSSIKVNRTSFLGTSSGPGDSGSSSSLITNVDGLISMDSNTFDGFQGVNGAVLSLQGFPYMMGKIALANCVFKNNIAEDSGGVIYSENILTYLVLRNCTFINNTATSGGALYIKPQFLNFGGYALSPYSAEIINSTFYQNQARDKGGAIFAKDFIAISSTSFIENSAAYGGAFYRSLPTQENVNAVKDMIFNCDFQRNVAQKQGGAFLIVSRNEDSQLSGLTFSGNSAKSYDNYFVGLPGSMQVKVYTVKPDKVLSQGSRRMLEDASLIDSYKDQEVFTSSDLSTIEKYTVKQRTGVYFPQIIEISILDRDGSIFEGIDEDVIDLSLEDCVSDTKSLSSTLKGQTSLSFVKGRALIYNQFELFGGINSDCSFRVKSNPNASPNLVEANFNIDAKLTVSFSGCNAGEVFNQAQQMCKKCQPGTYSLTNPDTTYECKKCPFDKATCPGSNVLALKPGYWRKSELSEDIRQCPEGSNACLGSLVGAEYIPTGKCQDLRTGSYCEECIAGHIKIVMCEGNPSVCVDCNNDSIYYVRFVGFLVVKIGIVALFIYLNVRRSAQSGWDVKPQDISSKTAAFRTLLIKIHINFLQGVSIISQFKLRWPRRLNMIPILISETVPMSEQSIVSECFLNSVFDGSLSNHFIQFFILSCLPLFLWLVSIILLHIRSRSSSGSKTSLKSNMTLSFIVIAMIFQPIILQSGLKTFDCTTLLDEDNEKAVMREDHSIECGSSKFYGLSFGLVIPVLLLWGLVLPGILFWKLQKNQKLGNASSLLILNDFERSFNWNLLIALVKLLLICFSAFLKEFPRIQVLLSFSILLLLIVGQIKYRPYTDSKLNKLEAFSLLILMLYIYSGLFFLNDIETTSPDLPFIIGFVVLLFIYFGLFGACMLRPSINKIIPLRIPLESGTSRHFDGIKDSQRSGMTNKPLNSAEERGRHLFTSETPNHMTETKNEALFSQTEILSSARLVPTLRDVSSPK